MFSPSNIASMSELHSVLEIMKISTVQKIWREGSETRLINEAEDYFQEKIFYFILSFCSLTWFQSDQKFLDSKQVF